jgi:Ni/Co efflux regulator RcnB
MKRILMLTVALGVVLAFAVAMAQTTKSGEVQDNLVIQAKVKPSEKLTKPGVGYSHKKHSEEYTNEKGAKIGCAECHHVYQDGKNTWKEGDKVQKCAECHEMKPAKTGKGLPLKLQTAMHTNCQDCHKALEKAKKKTGPTKTCNDCHTGKAPK